MPQQFHAVQCCSCRTFSVQQVKKVAKFKCAVCGEKQSVRQANHSLTRAVAARISAAREHFNIFMQAP